MTSDQSAPAVVRHARLAVVLLALWNFVLLLVAQSEMQHVIPLLFILILVIPASLTDVLEQQYATRGTA